MPDEIERKFLVRDDRWRSAGPGLHYRQGYLSTAPARTVRVRIAGDAAYITVKGKISAIRHPEYEYRIPVADAVAMLAFCKQPLIEKLRYRIEHAGLIWEVDEFKGENQGLLVAEVELVSEDQPIELPGWVGEEVTGDPRYYNANLVANPFSKWGPGREA